jgi:peptidoglycan/LPS O-acetylase OafA/YrhL
VFFTISGYLISESWDRVPNLARFFARRALRIFPALIVCTVLSIIVLGPLLTSLPLAD